MSKWQIPATGGNMEANNGIYYQNMTRKEIRFANKEDLIRAITDFLQRN